MRTRKLLVPIAALGVLLLVVGAASAQSPQSNLTVSYPEGFAVSPPLSHISQSTSTAVPALSRPQTVIPLRPRPLTGRAALAPVPMLQDRALQTTAGAPLELEDEEGQLRFPGVGANGSAPPDPNIAVGPNHIVQVVNTEVAVYTKSGTIFSGYPKTLGSVFNNLGGGCTGEWGDPIVQYDKVADRWLISQLESFSAPFGECIAISQTNDPTGAYYLYSYSFGMNLNDYPKFGVWPSNTNSAYLGTYNLFANGAVFVGAALCAYDRVAMLSGAANPAQVCFTIANDAGYLPSDLDGPTLPPAGSPGIFLTFETLSSLRYYQLSPNFANPSSSTLSAPTDITVASFTEACGGGTCIPQPGTTQQLDSLGDRPMYRMAYRNFGDHDALVLNHSVTAGSSVGVRWYELRSPLTGAFTLYQQGTFAPDSTYRWMASTAMDQAGDIAIGYSTSSSSVFPSIGYTGRAPTDPLGTMRAETNMLTGSGAQTGGLSRWGDYTALRIDPSDDCTFWYTNQYQPSNGSFNWATFIGSFKFTNCGTGPAPDFLISASPGSQTVVQGNPTSYSVTVTPSGGFTSDVTLSVSGLPSGASGSFAPNPITGGSGGSTLNVTTSSSTTPGTYTVTITGTSSPNLTHSTTVTLVVTSASSGDFSLSASPSSQTVTPGNPTSYGVTVTPSGGFSSNVTLSVSGLPSGANGSFSPNPITGGSGSSTLSVTTSTSTPSGTYTVTITGTSSSNHTHSTTVTLVVTSASSGDFSLSASPSSRTVTAGGSTSYTVAVASSGGFTSSVTLSVSGLPSGANATFTPNPIGGGSGNSTMNISTSSGTLVGSYTVTITGTSSSPSRTHSTTVTLVVNSFSISASPSSETVTRGNSATYTVTVTPHNGFNGTVTFSVRGLPSGSTASFSPSSVTGSGTSKLTINTNASTSTGTFSVRIRGNSGGVTHSTTVQLVVQ
jgi:uncharacterized membrane protein